MKKLIQSKKAEFLVLVAIVISISVSSYFKFFDNHPPRYCDEKKRVLTNEDFIIAALEHRYKYNAIETDDSTKTAKDFYKKYPNCCKTGRAPPMMMKNLWGHLYDGNQNQIVMTLFYPTNERRLANLIKHHATTWSGGHRKYIDKTMAYSEDTIRMSECGGVGDAVIDYLNIKDTPFANKIDK